MNSAVRTVVSGVLVLLATAWLRNDAEATQPPPSGFYVLSSEQMPRPIDDASLTPAAVAGVSLRQPWRSLEPVEGSFQWDYLDREIARAKRLHKHVMIRILPGLEAPDWVYDAGGQAFWFVDANVHHARPGRRLGDRLRIPLPWDPIMLAKWKTLIRALADRYVREEAVVLVHMAGPTATSGEMHLPKTREDLTEWKRIGYTPERLAGAWRAVIDAYAQAFPQTALALNVARPLENDGVIEAVVGEAVKTLGARARIQHNALSAKTRQDFLPHKVVAEHAARAPIGYQMLSPSTSSRFGGDLAQALEIGIRLGAAYFEIYRDDVKANLPVIERYATRMRGSGPATGSRAEVRHGDGPTGSPASSSTR